MTAEERAFVEKVRGAAMSLCAAFAACETSILDNPRLAVHLAKNGGRDALALCAEAGKRLGQAELAADEAGLQAGGYDLNSLATAAPSPVKE